MASCDEVQTHLPGSLGPGCGESGSMRSRKSPGLAVWKSRQCTQTVMRTLIGRMVMLSSSEWVSNPVTTAELITYQAIDVALLCHFEGRWDSLSFFVVQFLAFRVCGLRFMSLLCSSLN